eukprot:2734302-Prymnesium_polylepis.1
MALRRVPSRRAGGGGRRRLPLVCAARLASRRRDRPALAGVTASGGGGRGARLEGRTGVATAAAAVCAPRARVWVRACGCARVGAR